MTAGEDSQLTIAEAEQLVAADLGDSARGAHSRDVAELMARLAGQVGGDPDLWRIVGLCHDLDFFEVGNNWPEHGVRTAARLNGRLPDEALRAIAARDHRTGFTEESMMADMLKLADALAVACEHVDTDTILGPSAELRARIGGRIYLADMIERFAARHRIDLFRVLRRDVGPA